MTVTVTQTVNKSTVQTLRAISMQTTEAIANVNKSTMQATKATTNVTTIQATGALTNESNFNSTTESFYTSNNSSATDGIEFLDQSKTNNDRTLMVAVLVLVGTILLILILFIAIFVGRKLVKRCRRVQCHVCLEKVDKQFWESGHRSECQKLNKDFLKSLPEPFDIRCPHCLAYLKLMPKWCGKKFRCDDFDCPFRGGMILNHGYNRLNCFACDYDLCDSCVHKKIFVLTKVVKRGSINHPTQNCNICEPNVDFYPVGRYDVSNYSEIGRIETGCYVNSCYSSDPPSYRESPLPLPSNQLPYLLSTYV